ncbi:MAG: Rieske 2Fe-2S domain-containing protein [Arenicellales bacterium]|jgi:nitrite reductase/ring-hydroxylating ferredoxin subunit|nr:Rieske 2Fe-2S domain-containing protein [Arenicellales bacterium]MDP6790419.1 Rieske 2Fe-2S domain-containing protein [Arenicellales bacterium]
MAILLRTVKPASSVYTDSSYTPSEYAFFTLGLVNRSTFTHRCLRTLKQYSPICAQDETMGQTEAPARTYLCAADSLESGRLGFRFEVSRDGQTLPAFAIRHTHGVSAFLNRCGHRDLELDWSLGEFFDQEARWLICATHGALYDPITGSCKSGPCNRSGLTRLDIIEVEGVIYLVDTRYRGKAASPGEAQ